MKQCFIVPLKRSHYYTSRQVHRVVVVCVLRSRIHYVGTKVSQYQSLQSASAELFAPFISPDSPRRSLLRASSPFYRSNLLSSSSSGINYSARLSLIVLYSILGRLTKVNLPRHTHTHTHLRVNPVIFSPSAIIPEAQLRINLYLKRRGRIAPSRLAVAEILGICKRLLGFSQALGKSANRESRLSDIDYAC